MKLGVEIGDDQKMTKLTKKSHLATFKMAAITIRLYTACHAHSSTGVLLNFETKVAGGKTPYWETCVPLQLILVYIKT